MKVPSNRQGYWVLQRMSVIGLLLYMLCLASIQIRVGVTGADQSTAEQSPGMGVGIVFFDDVAEMRQARVAKAVQRLQDGSVSKLIMVGGWRPVSGYLGSLDMVEDAAMLGVSRNQLQHDSGSNDTWSNLENALALIPDAETARIELISDALHLARVDFILWRLGFKGSADFVSCPVTETSFSYFVRMNHELLGYALLIIPRELATKILGHLRARTNSPATSSNHRMPA